MFKWHHEEENKCCLRVFQIVFFVLTCISEDISYRFSPKVICLFLLTLLYSKFFPPHFWVAYAIRLMTQWVSSTEAKGSATLTGLSLF